MCQSILPGPHQRRADLAGNRAPVSTGLYFPRKLDSWLTCLDTPIHSARLLRDVCAIIPGRINQGIVLVVTTIIIIASSLVRACSETATILENRLRPPAGSERLRRRSAAEERDEFAPLHSITS
jgi:hypothetical protein